MKYLVTLRQLMMMVQENSVEVDADSEEEAGAKALSLVQPDETTIRAFHAQASAYYGAIDEGGIPTLPEPTPAPWHEWAAVEEADDEVVEEHHEGVPWVDLVLELKPRGE